MFRPMPHVRLFLQLFLQHILVVTGTHFSIESWYVRRIQGLPARRGPWPASHAIAILPEFRPCCLRGAGWTWHVEATSQRRPYTCMHLLRTGPSGLRWSPLRRFDCRDSVLIDYISHPPLSGYTAGVTRTDHPGRCAVFQVGSRGRWRNRKDDVRQASLDGRV